ncbi:5-formyltetrahydrofolate cyclo-ligase [Gordonia paraffinivorans]|uniref:5-formyltetrahydrofolate cyclo-ligase n=1 Tax=Gordonia paraffinivorans TaxID=175628 RepID=UPI0014489B9F|nr:5-formyltetrahydrofolate cyclo-ligase [Gordonia paraffinivorans]
MPTHKDQRRQEAASRRAAMPASDRERAALDLAEWIHTCPFRLEYDVTVAAYVPVGIEPGSVPADSGVAPTAMLDALLDRGVTVLLPVVPEGDPAPLDWARYTGPRSLETRRWGLLEPTGTRLGTAAIRAASVIFIPALAVDRTGIRLGRGAGYYDRSIAGLSAELVAVVYDDELVDSLPSDAHDVPVGWVLTPGGGFRELAAPRTDDSTD